MADRRMLTKKVTDDDNFLSLSASAQALYLHLSMSADDDGFSNQVSISMFKAHASLADLEALLARRYVYQFENGVIVIKHWKIHNYIQKDRYKPTVYQEEKALLAVKENNAYTMDTTCIQSVSKTDSQYSIGKVSIDQYSISNKPAKRFVPPSVDEVKAYCKERKNHVDPEQFVDFYTAKGWKVGKNGMKDWKAAVRTWERNEVSGGIQKQKPKNEFHNFKQHDYDFDAIERALFEADAREERERREKNAK